MKDSSLKNIYIPNPCHENWDQMNRMEKGRFCQSCNKKVHDFTNATSAEVEIIFKKSKGEACGTFYQDQINQDLKYLHKEKISLFRRIKLTVAASLVSVWLKLFFVSSANAQEISDSIDSKDTISVIDQDKMLQKNDQIKIKGILKNKSSGLGISFIKLKIYDNKGKQIYLSQTNEKGMFNFSIPIAHEGTELKFVAEKSRKKGPRYIYISKSATAIFTATEFQEILLETDVVVRKKLFRKKRIVRTGRFRYDVD